MVGLVFCRRHHERLVSVQKISISAGFEIFQALLPVLFDALGILLLGQSSEHTAVDQEAIDFIHLILLPIQPMQS
jgi:hypothetical protein